MRDLGSDHVTVLANELPQNYWHRDWQDLTEAIEAFPDGTLSGPDSVPVVMMKKAKSAIQLGRILSVIFRTTVKSGEIPAVLKLAFIPKIFKSGSKTKPVNHRQISLTSHVAKIMGKVLRKAIVNHLEFNLKLAANQDGSRAS